MHQVRTCRIYQLTSKDADVIVLDGPSLSVKSWVQQVYVNAELVYTK